MQAVSRRQKARIDITHDHAWCAAAGLELHEHIHMMTADKSYIKNVYMYVYVYTYVKYMIYKYTNTRCEGAGLELGGHIP